MTSQELKADRAKFVSNVESFIDTYNNVLNKISALSDTFSGYDDTILRTNMLSQNNNLLNAISNMISKISSEKQSVLAKVDQEIKRLEDYEASLLKEKEEETEE